MAEYRHSAHAVYDLRYHVIWCTKYRYKILRGRVAERARDLIRQICQTRDVVIVRGAVSPDHIHLLLSAPPVLSPAELAQYIKRRSSRNLQAEFPDLRGGVQPTSGVGNSGRNSELQFNLLGPDLAKLGNYADQNLQVFHINGDKLEPVGEPIKLPGQPASMRGVAR